MTVKTGDRVFLQNAAAALADGNLLYVDGLAVAMLQVVGTFSGTVTFEATVDGANWGLIRATNQANGTAASTATGAGLYKVETAGLTMIRARISAYTSGTITVVAGTSQ